MGREDKTILGGGAEKDSGQTAKNTDGKEYDLSLKARKETAAGSEALRVMGSGKTGRTRLDLHF